MSQRSTYPDLTSLSYRMRAAAALLAVSDTTLKQTIEQSKIHVKRANDGGVKTIAARVFDPDTLFQLARFRRENSSTRTVKGPVVLTVDIIKGGTGKTTTSVELATHLALMGYRVIAIDLDAQTNLTHCLGYEADLNLEELDRTVFTEEALVGKTFSDLITSYCGRRPSAEAFGSVIKKPFGEYGPHLIPADANLGDMEYAISTSKGQRELTFKRFFRESMEGKIPDLNINNYDFVILDCPPNVTMTSACALAAADYVVIPVRLDAFGVGGLSRVISEIRALKKEYGSEVKAKQIILPTHVSASLPRIQRMYAEIQRYKDILSPVSISQSEEFPKSLETYVPLTLLAPTGNPSREYRLFAEHVVKTVLSSEE